MSRSPESVGLTSIELLAVIQQALKATGKTDLPIFVEDRYEDFDPTNEELVGVYVPSDMNELVLVRGESEKFGKAMRFSWTPKSDWAKKRVAESPQNGQSPVIGWEGDTWRHRDWGRQDWEFHEEEIPYPGMLFTKDGQVRGKGGRDGE